MSVVRSLVRSGSYFDSIVLLRLQSGLKDLPGIEDAGAVMATTVNLEILAANDLLVADVSAADPDDLLIVVRGRDATSADEALGQVDELLRQRRGGDDQDYRPRSLATAVAMLPEARWVLISVPGAWAARVAGEALDLGRNAMLYSDNVSIDAEAALKRRAAAAGLLVMGPDCGTAQVGGLGLAFANRVTRGPVGLVAASGTGLQAITCRLHELGIGISQALGTGSRDLSEAIGATTTLQSLDLLARDPRTSVIVVVSKPPSRPVAASVLGAARQSGKPVVIYFIGQTPPSRRSGSLHFAASLADAADLAAGLASSKTADPSPATAGNFDEETPTAASGASGVADAGSPDADARASETGYLRGLFSGGTLAFEALQGLATDFAPLHSNVAFPGVGPVSDPARSQGHAVLDLGADEYTVGRLHPMMDPDLRLRRLRQEGLDPEVGGLLLDVVLGDGAHPDPAESLAPLIDEIHSRRDLPIAVVLVGTDLDPQGLGAQRERLEAAGARVFSEVGAAVDWLRMSGQLAAGGSPAPQVEVPLTALDEPAAAINVGLELFYDSLIDQGARAVQMEWRPPAGGDESLLALLERTR